MTHVFLIIFSETSLCYGISKNLLKIYGYRTTFSEFLKDLTVLFSVYSRNNKNITYMYEVNNISQFFFQFLWKDTILIFKQYFFFVQRAFNSSTTTMINKSIFFPEREMTPSVSTDKSLNLKDIFRNKYGSVLYIVLA